MNSMEIRQMDRIVTTVAQTDATGPDHLLALLDRMVGQAPGAVMMRHKNAGIWQDWTRADLRDLAMRQLTALAARGVGPGARVAVIGENRPALYTAVMAVQALGADAMPLGVDFLRRYGPPKGGATLAVAETEAAARWWPDEAVLLSDIGAAMAEDLPASAPQPGRVLLHDEGRNAAPALLPMTVADLHAQVQRLAPGLSPGQRLIAYLPVSSCEDAALSLMLPLSEGAVVHCVEGPATFPLDLREVAPDLLIGPARAWELIDRALCQRLGRGRDPLRAVARPLGRMLFTAPLRNELGLARVRIASVSAGVLRPGTRDRLAALGLSMLDGADANEENRAEALLRDSPVVDRARVYSEAGGLRAEIATEPTEAARLIDDGGSGALTAALDAAARRVGLNDWCLREGGFAAHELTLFGETRHISAAPPPVPAAATMLRHAPVGQEALMEAQGVSISFGGVKALSDVSMQVRRGEILSIIGPNGAGKTSFLNALNGIYTPTSGKIVFEGRTRARMRPAEAAASGIGRTFQHVALFPGMNVIENVVAGRAGHVRNGFPGAFLARALRLPQIVAEESAQRAFAENILDFLDLTPLRAREVSTLPYGVQKRVELGRALAGEPRILLLDEPMAGMTHEEKQDMCRFIRAANAELGTTIVLIEHDIGVVMGLSDRVVVLNYGRKIADGTPDEVRANPEVIQAYLGTGAETQALEG